MKMPAAREFAMLSMLVVVAVVGAASSAVADTSDGGAKAGRSDCSGGNRLCPPVRVETQRSAVQSTIRTVDLSGVSAGSGSGSGSGGSSVSVCSYEPVWASFDRQRDLVDDTAIPMPARFFRLECGERQYLRWWVPGESDPVGDGVVSELVQEAVDRIEAVVPELELTPPVSGIHLTGLASWLAVSEATFAPVVGSVSSGPVTVSAWLEPVETRWVTGDGGELVCSGRGSVFDPDWPLEVQERVAECRYVFASIPGEGAGWEVSAMVVYRAGYEVSGIPGLEGTFDLGVVEGPEQTVTLDVREYRAVRVG
jgi:hypothetical protein